MAKSKKNQPKVSSKIPVQISNKKIFIILFLIFIIWNILNYDPKLFLGGDNIEYLILAKSLLSGNGYKKIYEPTNPHHTTYPPGFPLLLIPAIIVFGNNYALMKIYILLFSLGAFYLFYQLLKNRTRLWVYPVSLFAFSPLVVNYSHYLLSEIPYLFFSLLALWIFKKYQSQYATHNEWRIANIGWFLLMLISFIITYYIRTVGLALLLAGFICLVKKKNYIWSLIYLLIVGIFFYLWQHYTAKYGESDYLRVLTVKNPYDIDAGTISLGGLIGRFFQNIKLYTLSIFPQILLPSINKSIWLTFWGVIFSGTILIGLINKLKHFSILELYTIIFLGITFSWPEVWTGDRFLLPILPLLFYYLFLGIKILTRNIRFIPVLVTAFCILIALIEFAKITPTNLSNFRAFIKGDKMAGYEIDWQHYFQAIDWIKNNTPQNSVVVSRKPQFTYLLSNRKSCGYPFTADENKIFESFQKNNVQYILFDHFLWTGTTVKYLGPVIKKNPNKFEVIYKTDPPEMYVLKIL